MNHAKYLLAAAALLTGCTDDTRSHRVLEEAGYTDVKITGYAFAECSDSDTYSTGFSAKGPSGKRVTGAVCCGLLKGCTIRSQ